MTIIFRFRVSELQFGDGIDIERQVIATIIHDSMTIDKGRPWTPYCRVNTNATNSTHDEAHRLVDLLNLVEDKKAEGFNHGQA